MYCCDFTKKGSSGQCHKHVISYPSHSSSCLLCPGAYPHLAARSGPISHSGSEHDSTDGNFLLIVVGPRVHNFCSLLNDDEVVLFNAKCIVKAGYYRFDFEKVHSLCAEECTEIKSCKIKSTGKNQLAMTEASINVLKIKVCI